MRRFSRSLIALGGLAGLAACGDDVSIAAPTPTPVAVVGVTVSPASLTLRVGEKATLGVSVAATGGAATTVTWVSSTPAVATVSATGEVAAVAAGNTTVRATSTADASKSGAAQVSVTAAPVARVQSVSVAPGNGILAPGEKLQLTANVTADAGVARTVTWRSSDALIATVDANGTVSAVAPGTASIVATSTADATVSGSAGITVRTPAAASVSIQSITTTAGGFFAPVNLNNVLGQIEVRLNVDPGDRQLAEVAVYVGTVKAASQTFGASALVAGTDVFATVAPSEVALSVNTAAFAPVTGVTSYPNGSKAIRAVLFTRGTGSTAVTESAQASTTIILRNTSGFIGKYIVENGGEATDPSGLRWKRGDVRIQGLAVNFGNTTEPFAIPTIANVQFTLTGSGCGIAPRWSNPAPGVITVTGAIVRTKPATQIAGTNNWESAFSNDAANLAAGADNVVGYENQANNCSTFGEVPTVLAVGSDGNPVLLGGMLNSPYNTTSQVTQPDAALGVRLDNQSPIHNTSGTWAPGACGTSGCQGQAGYNYGFQDGNSTPVAGTPRLNRWMNEIFRFTKRYTGGSLSAQGPMPMAADFGSGFLENPSEATFWAGGAVPTRIDAITYEGRSASCTASATTVDGTPAITTADALAESSSNLEYRIRLRAVDPVGNSRRTSVLDAGGNILCHGVDKADPTMAFDGSSIDDLSQWNIALGNDFVTLISDPAGGSNFTGSNTGRRLRRRTTAGTGCVFVVSGGSCLYQATSVSGLQIDNATGTSGIYIFDAYVYDDAGNGSPLVTRTAAFDDILPSVGGVTFPSVINGGVPVQFQAPATDNLHLVSGWSELDYGAGYIFRSPSQTVAAPFADPVVPATTVTNSTPYFVRFLETVAVGVPTGAFQFPSQLQMFAVDIGGNTSASPTTTFGTAVNNTTLPPATFAGVPFQVATWNVAAAPGGGNVSGIISRNGRDGASPATRSSVSVQATLTLSTGNTNPFGYVQFYWNDGAKWRLIGSSTANVNPTSGTWRYQLAFNPDDQQFPESDLALPGGAGAIVAVGVNTQIGAANTRGQGIATGSSPETYTVVP